MLIDIKDKDGNTIVCVKTVRREIKYGDGCGHVVETEIHDDLSMSDFKGMDLQNADFRGMDLFQANFYDANLMGADFRGADVRQANFYGAKLDGADFRGVKLSPLMDYWGLKDKIIYDEETEFYKHKDTLRPSYL